MLIRNENQKQLDIQSNIMKEQLELCDNLKIFEELNDKLKKDNFTLKEQNEYLVQINTNLVEEISSIKLSQQEIQEETDNKFKDMCENYDNVSILKYFSVSIKILLVNNQVAWPNALSSIFRKKWCTWYLCLIIKILF